MLGAALFRHTLHFERRTQLLNTYRELVGEWQLLVTERGSIEPLQGDEFFRAMQVQAAITARIRCRYSPRLAVVLTTDRVRTDGAIYDIRAVIDVNMKHRELHFMVRQHEAAQ